MPDLTALQAAADKLEADIATLKSTQQGATDASAALAGAGGKHNGPGALAAAISAVESDQQAIDNAITALAAPATN